MEDSVGNVKVVCRFRPFNEKELSTSPSQCVTFVDSQTVMVASSPDPLRFSFDNTFDPSSSQSSVYQCAARPIVEAVMEGFNGTVFAYGQTSSGKTHTMSGPDLDDPDMKGIIPRMVDTVFDDISEAGEHMEFSVKVAYAEIYMEHIRDLLDPTRCNLKVHEDRTRGVFIKDLTEHYVGSQGEVLSYMKLGTANREVGATNMNAGSSRSHAIFCMTVVQNNRVDYSAKTGKLYLVDLAGSEKVGKTGAEGKRLEEAKTINKSLTVLGHVINSLTDEKSSHVPYRDSKLTRVLQDSLGGNSKTTLIITCSPSEYNLHETLSTLRFGIRAKAIKNKPKVNREYTVAELKLLLANSKEDLKVMTRRVSTLEAYIKSQNLELPSCDMPVQESDEVQSVKNEVIDELEENRKNLACVLEENAKLKKLNDAYLKEIHDLKGALERESIEREEIEEKFKVEKESLENEVANLHDNLMKLEKAIIDKEIEYQEALISTPVKEPAINQQQSTPNLDKESKLEFENQELKKEVERLKNELERAYKAQLSNDDTVIEAVRAEERQKWKIEKKQYARALDNKVKDYIQVFQVQLQEAKIQYETLEKAMVEGHNILNMRNQNMENNLNQIMKLHKDLKVKNSKLKAENTYYKKKCQKFNELVKRMKEQVDNLQGKEDYFRLRKEVSFDMKVRKTIVGGNKHIDAGLKHM